MLRPTLLSLFTVLLYLSCSLIAYADQPNVVIFMTDDQGTLDANCFGSGDLHTPHIDRLAKNGVSFTQAYAHIVCCPSRAQLLTGRYPQRSNVNTWQQGQPSKPGANMSLSEVTLAEAFKTAGYKTALFGKWHLGAAHAHEPTRQGFDEFFGIRGGFIDNYNHHFLHGKGYHDLYDGRKEVELNGKYFPDLMVEKTLRYLERNKENPFFLFVSLNIPHYPEQAYKKFDKRYAHLPEPRRSYAKMISSTDDCIGRVLNKLDSLNLTEKSVILFLSDNGHSEERYRISVENHSSGLPKGHVYGALGGGGNTGIWRGSKNSFFEGGLRVPAILSFPKKIPHGVKRHQAIMSSDFYPTLLEICDLEKPDVDLDGKSLLSILDDPNASSLHESFHWQWFGRWAVRKDQWKLIADSRILPKGKRFFLANLNDRQPEQKNYADEKPELVKKLFGVHQNWAQGIAKDRMAASIAIDKLPWARWIRYEDKGKVRAWSQLEVEGGKAYRAPQAIYFELAKGSQRVNFPRLNNQAIKARLLGDSDPKQTIKLLSEPYEWSLKLPKGAEKTAGPKVILLELQEKPHFSPKPFVNKADKDGSFLIPAHHAVTSGELLRYEPQAHKNCVGYWVKPKDWVQWFVEIKQPGKYEVEIFQGCGKGQGGSTAEIKLAGNPITFKVEDTGHFQNFKWRKLGVVEVDKKGKASLELRVVKIAKQALLDVRRLRLTLVK